MYWVEVRAFPDRVGKPFFVPATEVPHASYTGFRSVYAYDARVRDMIVASGSSANLRGEAVYSDCLFVDFDDQPDAAQEFLLMLYDAELQHTVWDSGGRSVHVHLPVTPEHGAHVPASQRAWIVKNAPGADTTFYHPAGMYRLPGTRHRKTGKRKVLVRELGGAVLCLPRVEACVPRATTAVRGGDFMRHLLRHKTQGGRRVYAWHLAQQAKQDGYTYDEAVAKIMWWNTHYCSPQLTADEIIRKILEVYKPGRL